MWPWCLPCFSLAVFSQSDYVVCVCVCVCVCVWPQCLPSFSLAVFSQSDYVVCVWERDPTACHSFHCQCSVIQSVWLRSVCVSQFPAIYFTNSIHSFISVCLCCVCMCVHACTCVWERERALCWRGREVVCICVHVCVNACMVMCTCHVCLHGEFDWMFVCTAQS